MPDHTPEEAVLFAIMNGIVEFPDEINIVRSTDDRGVFLSLRVAETDAGRIIGREGVTAKSIREIMHAVGKTHNRRISLKIEN